MANNVELERRLIAVERRLARLEAGLSAAQAPSLLDDLMPGPPPPPPAPASKPIPASAPRGKAKAPAALAGHAPRHGASDLLAIVAVLCFVLAAAWMVKLAIDSGWLTPARRVAMTAVSGVALIGAGLGLRRSDRAYAAYLPAAGVILLYLAAYSGHGLYDLYEAPTALGLVALVSALALGLYFAFREAVYPLVAQVGTYLVPLLLPSLRGAPVLVGFFLVWDILFTALALVTRERLLLPLAGYLALGSFSLAFELGGRVDPTGTLVFQAAQMAIFLLGSLGYTLIHQVPMRANEAWAAFPLLLFFYGIEYALLLRIAPEAAPWVGLGWAALLVAAYAMVRAGLERSGLEAGPMVSTYASVIVFHALYLQLTPSSLAPWLALAILPCMAWAAVRPFGKRHLGVVLASALLIFLEYWHLVLGSPAIEPAASAVAAGFAFSAVLLFLGIQAASRPDRDAEMDVPSLALLAAANLQALIALYRLNALLLPEPPSAVISVTWAVYGVALMGLAWGLRLLPLAQSALVLLLLVAGKAMLADTAGAEPILRIVSFACLGGLLYGAGLLYRHVRSWA